MYPDEIPIFYKEILKRDAQKKKDKFEDYKMLLLSIHSENPKEIYEKINKTSNQISKNILGENIDDIAIKEYYEISDCDRNKLESLKKKKGF